MSILSAPSQVSRTFKNIGRIKQISSVFAKHGFQDFMGKLGFSRFIPDRYKNKNPENQFSTSERLRMALEELGPTFIKLGQVLSSRSDLLPEEYVTEFVKLQDRVSPLPFTVIKNSVERELNTTISEIFSFFSETPLASASIGQVHEAKLKNGREVVVKVQRPGLDTLIKTDVSILSVLAAALEKYFPETQVLAPQVCVQEFFHAMSQELDFIIEANNIIKSRANLQAMEEVYIPEVFLQYSTHKILVIEKLNGIKLDRFDLLKEKGLDQKLLAETIAKAFLKSALEDGFFHGDLHMGNLFALEPTKPNGPPRIGLIDFGIVGYLTPRARESLVRIFLALSEEDFETLCMEYAELGASRGRTDFDTFERNIHSSVAPYLGLPLASINVGKILIEATSIAAKHQIRIPREWMMIFKALYTLEGTCRKLDPNFNAMPLLETYLTPLLQPELSWKKFSKDMLLGSRDMQVIAQSLPRQLNWMFKRLAANGYAIEIKDSAAEENRMSAEKNSKRIASAIFAGMMLFSSCFVLSLALQNGSHYLYIFFFALLGLSLFLYRR